VNRRFDEAFFESQSDQTVRFWLGSCCQYCTPNPTRVRFEGVVALHGLDEATVFSDPVFRLASPHEIAVCNLDVEPDARVFCLSSFGEGPDGPRILVIARTVEIVAAREEA
jgi:hypothetical protein